MLNTKKNCIKFKTYFKTEYLIQKEMELNRYVAYVLKIKSNLYYFHVDICIHVTNALKWYHD